MIDYHTRLDAQSAVLYYKGPFDKDILANISLQLRRRFAENPRMSAKLFSIFIELAQNIAYYSEESNFFYDEEGKKDVRYSDETRKNMKKILKDIQSGAFAREWILENKAGRPVYNPIKKKEENHLIEKVGKELRKMMTWIKKEED